MRGLSVAWRRRLSVIVFLLPDGPLFLLHPCRLCHNILRLPEGFNNRPLSRYLHTLSVGRMTPKKFYVKVSLSYFALIKTVKSSCRMSMKLVSVGQSMMAVNTSVAFCRARVR